MYRKIAVVGVTAAAIVGAGTAALAASGPDDTAGNGTVNTASVTSATPPSGSGQGKHRLRTARALVRHSALHGSIVTHGKEGYVRHSGIRGTITGVSPTAITVKAADGFSQTFTLTKDTVVRERTPGHAKGTKGSVSDLKTGDSVGVLGKSAESSTAAPTASVVIDGVK